MGRTVTTINEEVVTQAQACLDKLGDVGPVSTRLRIIIAAYHHGVKQVCEVLEVSRPSVHRWMVKFRQEGVEGLRNASKPARSKLNAAQKAELKRWLEAKPTSTLKELVLRIEEEMGLLINKSSVHRTLMQLGFAHITGRKRYYKADPAAQDSFKKNSKH
jgi:transposase